MLIRWIAVLVIVLGSMPALAAEEAWPTTQMTLPGGRPVTLELAATPHRRNLGLMFRPALAPDRGMLFLFPASDRHAIWMKNMLIPIDILWLDEEHRIVHIEANVPPCRHEPCLIYQSPTPARYVIELAAGAAAQADLRPGTALPFSVSP
ncbi:MAG: DUF192 domain-containing protein [Nitrospirota bacterium]